MRIEEIKIYKFNELTDEQKEKAIEKWRENDWDSMSFELDDIKSSLDDLSGFTYYPLTPIQKLLDAKKIYDIELVDYSLGGRGEYAKFSFDVDDDYLIDCIMKENLTVREAQLANHLIDDSIIEYYHDSDGFYIDYCLGYIKQYERLEKFTKRVADIIELEFNQHLEEIQDCLESYVVTSYNAQLEYINSDEYITETIEANDYEFYDNGKIA